MLGMPLSTLSTYVGAMLGTRRRQADPEPDRRTIRPAGPDRPRARGRPNGQPGVHGRARRPGGGPRATGRRGPGRAARDPGCDRPRRRAPDERRQILRARSILRRHVDPADVASIESRCPCSCWLRCSAAVPARARSPRAARSDADARPQSARARAAARPPASGRRRRRRRRDPRRRIADLDYLVEQLKAIHPNPFLDEGEAGFMARVASDRGRGTVDDRRRVPRRGHGPDGPPRARWPLGCVGDGPAGRSCSPPGRSGCGTSPTGCGSSPRATPYADLVGARVTKVGHLAVADARQAVEPLVPRDNASSLRGQPADLPAPPERPRASSASSPPATRG